MSSIWTLTWKLFGILQVWILLQAKNGFHSNTTKLINIFWSLAISNEKKQKSYGYMKIAESIQVI